MHSQTMACFQRELELLRSGFGGLKVTGRVREITGLTVAAEGLPVPVGAMCTIAARNGERIDAQVVGFRGRTALLAPLSGVLGAGPGDAVTSSGAPPYIAVGEQMLGSVLNGLGQVIDAQRDSAEASQRNAESKFQVPSSEFQLPSCIEDHYPIFADPPAALERLPIDRPLPTGIRSIDAMHTLGAGQRLGIFAGTGVGKSVLMGMIVRNTAADVVVAALVGERGREVGDFIRRDLGPDGMRRTVLVVSTSDESPVLRVRACFVASAIAEFFRDRGRDVLLIMDSVTRMAMAQRQIGLAAGEPPATKGYPPSVFALLPRLLERAGRTSRGSITGLYTVLVEGDDLNDPISDAARGVLDGHIWLARPLANRGHYPAVSVLESISRVMPDVVDPEVLAAAAEVRRVLAVWSDIEDLVNIGAYVPGVNVDYDVAVRMKPRIDEFLRQGMDERAVFESSRARLLELGREIVAAREKGSGALARKSEEKRSVETLRKS